MGFFFEKRSNIKVNENTSMGTEMLHADGQADMTKLVTFHNLATRLTTDHYLKLHTRTPTIR